MREKLRLPSYILAFSLITTACDEEITKTKVENSPTLSPTTTVYHLPLQRPFYNQGPHPAVPESQDQTPSALDFASEKVISCEGNTNRPIKELENETVFSMATGTLLLVGDEDRQSETHSVVKIKNKDNTFFTYVHLDNIPPSLRPRLGQVVYSGEILGTLSCEIPNDGKSKTTGAHLHVIYSEIVEGKERTKSVIGESFSGYKVKENGSMVRENDMRVPNENRCGPSQAQTNPLCNGERNDLNPFQPEYFPGDSRYQPKNP